MIQCEGFRRYGGAFTIGPVEWEQCKNEAIVSLLLIQEGKKQIFPACKKCWEECIEKGIKIIEVKPI